MKNYQKKIFLFSGQGGQYFEMGKVLYNENNIFKSYMDSLDEMIKEEMNESIIDKLYYSGNTKSNIFNRTLYTHPAIFMIQYALAKTVEEEGIKADYLLGASLGEYVSLTLSGVLSLRDALKLIICQAALLEKHCEEGRMITILDNPDIWYNLLEKHTRCEIAAHNYEDCFVVAGYKEETDIAKNLLKEGKVIYNELPVRFGFHSYAVDEIREAYMQVMDTITINNPQIPILSSVQGEEIHYISKDYLWDIIRKPIKFNKVIEKLPNDSVTYINLGTSSTLTNFIKRIKKNNSNMFTILDIFGDDSKRYEKLMEQYK